MVSKQKEKINYPSNRNLFFYCTLVLSFFTSLVFYLATLAPSITFEDSGELITAAYNNGIAHEPGYPLFTILGNLFCYLPFGNVAFRLNLMSAVFSSLASVLVCLCTILLIEISFNKIQKTNTLNSKTFQLLRYSAGFSAAMFCALSYENWEQSIITEVYSLHSFFVSLFILLIIIWSKQLVYENKRRYIYLLSLITGLSMTNHTTSIFFIPIVLMFLVLIDFRFILNIKTILYSLTFVLIGLLPLLYLPIASSADPILDWGDPENLTNFLRVIGRSQYLSPNQNSEKFLSALNFYFTELLVGQWFPVVLLLLIPAFIVLYKSNRKFLIFFFNLSVFLYPCHCLFNNQS